MGTGLRHAVSRRILTRWTRLADDAPTMPAGRLRDLSAMAVALRARLDRLIATSDRRLGGAEQAAIRAPLNSDWTWRPSPWSEPIRPASLTGVVNNTGFGHQATLFHDAGRAEFLLRQTPTRADPSQPAGATFIVTLSAYEFDGSFLSLVFDLPPDAIAGLNRRFLVRLDPVIEAEYPTEVFARLNISHGPNIENIVREIPMHAEDRSVDFDLGYTKVNEKRVDRMWLDLIVGQPAMNRVTIRDLTLSRRPRAEL